jgi:hypothetical protein
MSRRLVHKRRGGWRNEANELLQDFVINELLTPSPCIWLVSPWLRNVTLLDNRAGAYAGLLPEAPRRHIQLTDFLREMFVRGTSICTVTRSVPADGGMQAQIRDIAADCGATERLLLIELDDVHTKGFVGASMAIVGSMNFTYGGTVLNDELVTLTTDEVELAHLVVSFGAAYGRPGAR